MAVEVKSERENESEIIAKQDQALQTKYQAPPPKKNRKRKQTI
jgi:hypothetical protein